MKARAGQTTRPPLRAVRGAALIMVLGITVLLMVLVLGVLSIGKDRTRQGTLVADGLEADALARLPAEIIITQLQRATTKTTGQNGERLVWASQPGMIRVFGTNVTPGKDRPQAVMHHRLYSSATMNTPTLDADAEAASLEQWASQPAGFIDLNEPLTEMHSGAGKRVFPIADPAALNRVEGFALRAEAPGADAAHPLPMPVAWIYVLKDGQLITPEKVVGETAVFPKNRVTAENPVIGRIAFWTDDESCKINLNTATEADPWDMPGANTLVERGYAAMAATRTEFQRMSGHPAFTCLSPVLQSFGPASTTKAQWPQADPVNPLGAGDRRGWDRYIECYQSLVPHGVLQHTMQQKSHFATVDEFWFDPKRERNGDGAEFLMEQDDLRTARFFLTAHSSAPELNPFGLPKIALWNMPQNVAQRTTTDKQLALCSSLNAGTADSHEFVFHRLSDWTSPGVQGSCQSTSADWAGVARNRELYAWLQQMSGAPTPGFGGSFADKYGARSRDQILTSMFDMMRWCANPSLPPSPGATNPLGLAEQSAVPLIVDAGNGVTRGFGRFPTVTEISVVFAFTDVERKGNGQPRDDNNDGICDRATKLRVFIVLNPCIVSAGQPAVSPAWSFRFRRLMQWSIGSGISPQLPGGNVFERCILSNSLPLGGGAPWGGHATAFASFASQFLQSDGTPKRIDKRDDPARDFSFISAGDVMLGAADGKPGSTLAFSGGRVILDILSPDAVPAAPTPGDSIQSIEVEFPNNPGAVTQLPIPSLRVDDFKSGPRSLASRFQPVKDGDGWRLPLIQKGDIVRSMVLNPDGPSHGDLRLLAAQRELLFPAAAAWFKPHPNYGTPGTPVSQLKLEAQSLRDGACMLGGQQGTTGEGGRPQGTRDTAGSLLRGFTASANAIPDVPLGLDGAKLANGKPGDWESGQGLLEDGPFVNRSRLLPEGCFTRGSAGAVAAIAPVPPMSQMPSAVAFGAIPSGVYGDKSDAAPRPWQTLLFCPNPVSRSSNTFGRGTAGDHPGFGTPPDHLWLEYFWMPVTQPWAMSSRFATEGKVNMNCQLMPYTWLRRTTALYGALKGVRLTAIPTAALGTKGASAKGHEDGTPLDETFRYEVNAEKTLRAFEERFDGGDIFRTPSEICEMFLVPQRIAGHRYDGDGFTVPDPAGLEASGMAAWWNGSDSDPTDAFEATGDNLRESPYAQLHPRLCTQSNVYRVHYRVQLLAKSRSTEPTVWDGARDHVRVERRGAFVVERGFEPGNSPMPDPATSINELSLHARQAFHIAAQFPFIP